MGKCHASGRSFDVLTQCRLQKGRDSEFDQLRICASAHTLITSRTIRLKVTEPGIGSDGVGESQHVAGHHGLRETPVVVTYGAPRPVVEDLDGSLVHASLISVDDEADGVCEPIVLIASCIVRVRAHHLLYMFPAIHILYATVVGTWDTTPDQAPLDIGQLGQ